MKSVVIIGKGPSVKKSTKEFVDSFDEVAICNFPPMEKHDHLTSNRAQYHFFAVGAGDEGFSRDFLNSLGLTHVFNASTNDFCLSQLKMLSISQSLKERTIPLGQLSFLPDHPVSYFPDYGSKTKKRYQERYGFNPSTGMLAFDYFLNSDEHYKIGLVGFDFYQGEDVYYFSKNCPDGIDMTTSYSGHGGERAIQTFTSLVKESSKEIVWLK